MGHKKTSNKEVQEVWVIQYTSGGDPKIHGIHKTKDSAIDFVKTCIKNDATIWDIPESKIESPCYNGDKITWFFSAGNSWCLYIITKHAIE